MLHERAPAPTSPQEFWPSAPIDGPPAPVQGRRLQPLYYLTNFRLALATLEARYAGLLNEEESQFIARFACLSEPAQCLLTRMVMRAGPLFRRTTLQYAEVADAEKTLQ